MSPKSILKLQIFLLVAASGTWIWQSRSMYNDGALELEPNVFHLKRSPFGRTLALAMRGPVDVYWHRGGVHDHDENEHGHEHAANQGDHDHDHSHDQEDGSSPTEELKSIVSQMMEKEGEHSHAPEEDPAPKEFTGVRNFLLDHIDGMKRTYYTRTNNRGESKRHRAFIMGETEKRLKVSYEMDPSNLSGYGAYFLFLSEALARIEGEKGEEGVIVARRQKAHLLAHSTIEYCLKHQDEAPAMITAATAAHDCLQIVMEQPKPDRSLAASYLQTLDGTLIQYEELRKTMREQGSWQLFPLNRRAEMEKAYSLVRALQNVDHQMFGRLSKAAAPPEPQPSS